MTTTRRVKNKRGTRTRTREESPSDSDGKKKSKGPIKGSSFEVGVICEPSDDFYDYTWCLFGEKGIGKTSLIAHLDGAVTIMLEPKRRNLRIRQVEIRPYSVAQLNTLDEKKQLERTPWEEICRVLKACVKDPTCRLISVDTVDRAYEACLVHHCYLAGISDPGDLDDYGKTWRAIKDDFESVLNEVRYQGKGLALVSHAQIRELESVIGLSREQAIPTCSPAAFKTLKALCDWAFYYGYAGTERVIHVRGNQEIWSACGLQESRFLTKDGTPLEIFPTGDSAESAANALLAAFNNEHSSKESD